MINKELLNNFISKEKKTLISLKEKHNSLNQIDILSGEGNNLREKINKTEGKIEAYENLLKFFL